LSPADVVVTCLGDFEGEKGTLLKAGHGLQFDGVLTVKQLKDWHWALRGGADGS
jgi:hypothetical protein